MRLLPILLLSIPLYGFTPVKVTTQSAKSQNENFAGLAREIERRSLNQGGIVHQNLKISSSAHITGDAVIDGSLKVGGATTVEDLTVNGDLTLTGTLSNPAIATTYGIWVTSETTPVPLNAAWASINITSITRISAGQYTVTLSTPYVDASYGVFLGPRLADTGCSDEGDADIRGVRHFSVFCNNNAGTAKDPEKLAIQVFGTLDP